MDMVARRAPIVLVLGLAFLGLFSCTTVNHLDRYDFEDTKLALNLRTPPAPDLDTDYWVNLDSDNPVITVMRVGTTIAKAAEASRAEDRMRDALERVDVPGIMADGAYAGALSALDAQTVSRESRADFVLDLEIQDYGIDAHSYGGSVALKIEIVARLLDQKRDELVWRRHFSVSEKASPYLFGVHDVLGNVVTIGVLANLEVEDLEEGFQALAEKAAGKIARRLEDDLYEARYD